MVLKQVLERLVPSQRLISVEALAYLASIHNPLPVNSPPDLENIGVLVDSRKIASAIGPLREQGLAIVPGFLATGVAKAAGQALLDFVRTLQENGPDSVGIQEFLYVPPGQVRSYSESADSDTAVVEARGGVDQGMVDIFHVEKLFPDLFEPVRDAILSSNLVKVLGTLAGSELKLRNMNAYINRGVTSTRGFHVDSFDKPQFKAFIYLTDVLSLDDGPYTYVVGSFDEPGFREANQSLSKSIGAGATDLLAISSASVVPIIGQAGSLVVSNQNGGHRGWPQSKNAERCIVAMNFERAD